MRLQWPQCIYFQRHWLQCVGKPTSWRAIEQRIGVCKQFLILNKTVLIACVYFLSTCIVSKRFQCLFEWGFSWFNINNFILHSENYSEHFFYFVKVSSSILRYHSIDTFQVSLKPIRPLFSIIKFWAPFLHVVRICLVKGKFLQKLNNKLFPKF